MKRYMLLSYGFEKPTPEIMGAWKAWFEEHADKTLEQGGFHGAAKEFSETGARDLPLDKDAITGYLIIRAENLEEAEEVATANPFITAIRVYEIT